MPATTFTSATLRIGDQSYDLADVTWRSEPTEPAKPLPNAVYEFTCDLIRPRGRNQRRAWQRFYTLLRLEDGRRAHDAGPARSAEWQRGWSDAARARFIWDQLKADRREVRRMADGWATR